MKQQVSIYLPKDVITKYKVKCVMENVSISKYIENLIKEDLKKKEGR